MKALLTLAAILIAFLGPHAHASPGTSDPLPSWNDGASKAAIVDFVNKVTTDGSADFVKSAERIAVFDNDGTLWSEQPLYVQFAFAFDRVTALAPQHPDWKETEPFASILGGDMEAFTATGKRASSRY